MPVSAASLVTGAMALVLGQMLNPGGSESSPAGQLLVAAEYPGRWLAMSVLFFGGAVALILGLPAVLTLFRGRRGRALGLVGMCVFTMGCVGVGGLASLMLLFRAIALESIRAEEVPVRELAFLTGSLQEQALVISLGVWVYGFLAGVLLIALALLRARAVRFWVPGLLLAFLALQVVMPFLGDGTVGRVVSAVALLLLAAGLTGVATAAAATRVTGPVTHTLAAN